MLPKLLIQVRSPWLHFILKSAKKEKVARKKLKLLLVMHGPLNSHLISILMLHPIRVISDWKIMWIFWFPQESFILCFSELQISNLQWFETQMFESAKSVILNLEISLHTIVLPSGAVAQFRFLPFLLLRRPSSQWRYFVLIYCTIFWSYTAWVNETTSQGTGSKNDEKDQNHCILKKTKG